MSNDTRGSLPDDADARNAMPMADGLLYYFPNALAEVAKVSKIGNDQHNPGQKMHWARGKSTDHENKIIRHLVDAGKRDSKGVRHSAYLAWRALALLQEEIERDEGVPLPRNARPAEVDPAKALAMVEMGPPNVDDEWREWNGGECPVPGWVRVDYKMRDGDHHTEIAGELRWDRRGWSGDITAWRFARVTD